MIANIEHKSMDMEARDTNYWLQAYLISYLYVSQNQDPVKVIIPKFPSFPHPRKPGVVIPVEYVEVDSPIAVGIIKDGENIPAATVPVPEEVVEKPSETSDVSMATTEKNEVGSAPAKSEAAKAAPKEAPTVRVPKQPPGGDIGVGHADGLGSRDTGFDRLVVRDLRPEAPVDEDKEIDTDIQKPAA